MDEIFDEYGQEVSPFDDDYEYYKREYERQNDPLDDDYVREEYRNE